MGDDAFRAPRACFAAAAIPLLNTTLALARRGLARRDCAYQPDAAGPVRARRRAQRRFARRDARLGRRREHFCGHRDCAEQRPVGFAGNDQLKTNAVQIFKTKGVAKFLTV